MEISQNIAADDIWPAVGFGRLRGKSYHQGFSFTKVQVKLSICTENNFIVMYDALQRHSNENNVLPNKYCFWMFLKYNILILPSETNQSYKKDHLQFLCDQYLGYWLNLDALRLLIFDAYTMYTRPEYNTNFKIYNKLRKQSPSKIYKVT